MTFDEKKLAELRAKYGGDNAGEIFDPKFAKVGEKIFQNGTRAAPYAGVPTFLSAPHRPVDPRNPDFGDLQVAIVGVPMDLGVTNRPGSRFGPRAMRTIERIGPYNHALDCAPVQEALTPEFCGIYEAVKRNEYKEFLQVISPWEREHLLLNV